MKIKTKWLRKYFITGIIALLPAVAVAYVALIVIRFFDNIFDGLLTMVFGKSIPGIGLLLTIVTILFVGFFASNYIGKIFLTFTEKIISRIPIANTIYKTVKQIIDAFYTADEKSFKKVVLIEYPRMGIYALGFLTGTTKGEVQHKKDDEVVNIFLPTTPNPTSGFLLFLPRKDIIILEMSVEEGMKMIISGGVIAPPYVKKNKVMVGDEA